MEPNTEAILRLAWSRLLGLDDDAFDDSGRLLTRERDDLLMVVVLFGQPAVLGPGWALERCRAAVPGDWGDPAALGRRWAERPLRLLGQSELAATDGYVTDRYADLDSRAEGVSDDPGYVREIERSCTAAEVAAAGLTDAGATVTILDHAMAAVAAAGYRESQGLLADLGVLTPPQHRRRGWGTRAAAVAVDNAIDAGLVPWWRSRSGDPGAARIAATLGFTPIGSQTTFGLDA